MHPNDPRWRSLGTFLDDDAAADRFSGVVVLEHGGEVVFAGAYGHAHLGFRVANQLDTRFNLASVTKLFTTVAVLQLVEQGSLSIDATVHELRPDIDIGSSDRMTIHHLLTHQSGLGDYWNERCRQSRSVLRTTARARIGRHRPLRQRTRGHQVRTRPRSGELLDESSLRLMLPPPAGHTPSYGTQQVPYSRGLAIGHGGRAFGAASCLLFLREVDLSVCILSNYDRPADKRVFAEIDRLLD